MATPIKARSSTIESRAKILVQRFFESVWTVSFRCLGSTFRTTASVANPPGIADRPHQRVMVVAPHPDDEIAGCALAIAEHLRQGDRVLVVWITDGRRSGAFGFSPEDMATARHREALQVADLLGFEHRWLGFPEGDWHHQELAAALDELIEKVEPDLLYAPSRIDFHPQHLAVAAVLGSVLAQKTGHSTVIRIYPIQVPLSPILANVMVVSPEVRLVERAIEAYVTQRGTLATCLRLRRYSASWHGQFGSVEEFWQMSCHEYCALHSDLPNGSSSPPATPFRGMRYRAASDPIAYASGWSERRKMAERTEAFEAPDLDPEWHLRRFRAGDEEALRHLFQTSLTKKITLDTWHWKYLHSRHGADPSNRIWLAGDETDTPVLHYGGVPRKLLLDDEVFDAMTAFDGVTAKHFRRRGLLTAAVTEAHRHWRAAGFAGVLGLPNEQWGSRVGALNWQPLFELRWQIRFLQPQRAIAGRLRIRSLSRLGWLRHLMRCSPRHQMHDNDGVHIRELTEGNDQLESLCRATRPEVGLVKNRAWLEWRYLDCPEYDYRMLSAWRDDQLTGYLVFRFDPVHRYGFIADLLTAPEDISTRQRLIDHALREIDQLDATGVATLAVPGSALFDSFRRAGFFFSWGEFTVHCVPLAANLPLAKLREGHRWWLCGGDFDVI